MEQLYIRGGRPLRGTVRLHGAKNSVLPILAAALLPRCGESQISNCPQIADVEAACAILRGLGAQVRRQDDVICVAAPQTPDDCIPPALMRTMRASVLFLGALLARCGRAQIGLPGGCVLGERPIDLHLQALRQMGAEFVRTPDGLLCTAKKLHGCTITLPFPSVGATENVLLAAMAAEGRVTLCNAAREPEIAELAAFLSSCGAHISGAGTGVLRIDAGALHGTAYRVCPDRMEAATYLAAAAATRGALTLTQAAPEQLTAVCRSMRQAGCEIQTEPNALHIRCEQLVAAPPIRTAPYPAFPTDAQPVWMAALCTAEGTTVVEETVFPNRFRHVDALRSMGARIACGKRIAVISGVPQLYGAAVTGHELRGTAALVVAALAAQGESRVRGLCYLDRGYAALTEQLHALGAEIRRETATKEKGTLLRRNNYETRGEERATDAPQGCGEYANAAAPQASGFGAQQPCTGRGCAGA